MLKSIRPETRGKPAGVLLTRRAGDVPKFQDHDRFAGALATPYQTVDEYIHPTRYSQSF